MTVTLTSKTDPATCIEIHATHVSGGFTDTDSRLCWIVVSCDGELHQYPVADWFCDITP